MDYFREKPHFSHVHKFGEAINYWVDVPDETMTKINTIASWLYEEFTV
jgi:hypothetical protein